MYRLATNSTMHFVTDRQTDRQTDDIILTTADDTAWQYDQLKISTYLPK